MSAIKFLLGGYAKAGAGAIRLITLDQSDSRIIIQPLNGEAENPSWMMLHRNGKILYSVEEKTPDGRIAAFEIKGGSIRIAQRFSTGSAPCHLGMDPAGSFIYVSNYMDGSLDVFALNKEGYILDRTQHIQHQGRGADPERQEGPHVHSTLFYRDRLYTADLGLDAVFIYRQKPNGKLEREGRISFPSGCGPRHMSVHPEHPGLLYVNSEMGGNVYVVDLNSSTIIQDIHFIPDDYTGKYYASSIRFCGDTLHVGSRECDMIVFFTLKRDGTLCSPEIYRHNQKYPRDVWMNENWCITADTVSESVTLLRRKGTKLEELSVTQTPGLKPSCILQAELN